MPNIDDVTRLLNQSGWMHNRCRILLASYSVKHPLCDLCCGEAAFLLRLVDVDLAANNCGWQLSATSGMHPKPLWILNWPIQASKFDADATCIRT